MAANCYRGALLRDIRIVGAARRITAPPPPPPLIVLPTVSGGYARSECETCSASIWRKAESCNGVTICTSCSKLGVAPTCSICLERRAPCNFNCNHPGHSFCSTCLSTYITMRVDEGICDHPCPAPGCDCVINEASMKHLKARGYLSERTFTNWKSLMNVDRAERLKSVFTGDPQVIAWFYANAQACPHCYLIVQKDQGCNNMTCKCGGSFCYACGADTNSNTASGACRDKGCSKAKHPILNSHGLLPEPPEPSSSSMTTMKAAVPGQLDGADAGAPCSKAEARARIVDAATLKCPNARCNHAVHMEETFDSCFSLQCGHCSTHFSPEDMRGSALYLHDHNGPHLPPHPSRKFRDHWKARLTDKARDSAMEMRASAAASGMAPVLNEAEVSELLASLE